MNAPRFRKGATKEERIYYSPWVIDNLKNVFRGGEAKEFSIREMMFLEVLKGSSFSIARHQGKVDLKRMYLLAEVELEHKNEKQALFDDKHLAKLGVTKLVTVVEGCTTMILRFRDGSSSLEFKIGRDFDYERTFLDLLRKVRTSDYGLNSERKSIINKLSNEFSFRENVDKLRALQIKPAQAITVLNGERASRRQSGNVDKLLKKILSHRQIGLPNTYDKFTPSEGIVKDQYMFSQHYVRGSVLHPGGGKMSANSSACFDSSYIVDPLFNGPPSLGYRGTYNKYIAGDPSKILNFDNVASDACGYVVATDPMIDAHSYMKSLHPRATNDISASILRDCYNMDFQRTNNSRGKKRRIVLKCALEHEMNRNKEFDSFRYQIMSKQRAPNLEIVLDCFDKRYLRNKNFGVDIKEIELFLSATTYAGCLSRMKHSMAKTAPSKKYVFENKLPDAVVRIFNLDDSLPDFEPLESLNYFDKVEYMDEDESEQYYPDNDDPYFDIIEELELTNRH